MLHSAFWLHGAGELDLPSWWRAALDSTSGTEPEPAQHTTRSRSEAHDRPDAPHAVFQGVLLDFLCPGPTLAWFQQLSRSGQEAWYSRWSQRYSSRRGKRSYSSDTTIVRNQAIADEISSRQETAEAIAAAHTSPLPSSTEPGFDTSSPLLTLLQSADRESFDTAWRLYHSSGSKFPGLVLEYLATSTRPIDAERVLQLFDLIPAAQRRALDYRHAINARVSLSARAGAIKLHQEAAAQGHTDPYGSDIVLADAVEHEDWKTAMDAWRAGGEGHEDEDDLSPLWERTKQSSRLVEKVFALVEYAKQASTDSDAQSSSPASPQLLDFTAAAIRQALLRLRATEAERVPELLGRLRELRRDQARDYNSTIFDLKTREQLRPAVEVYKALRHHQSLRPNSSVMRCMLSIFCALDDLSGIQMVMDDMSKYQRSGPSPWAYTRAMYHFSGRGDVRTVQRLLKQLLARHPDVQNYHLHPLLHVYARRGDLAKTADLFHRLGSSYGLDPDLISWNILLSAYGKANDVEGASRCFDDLVQTSLRPDAYTYGTMIGIYANRGDVDRVESLLQQVERDGVRANATMYDGLVLAHVNDEDVDAAEEVAERALSMGLPGSLTRMWNHLLRARAFRRDVGAVSRVYGRMQRAGVPFDGDTYAALMQALVMVGQTHAAHKILHHVMPREGVRVKAFHYAIVMGGYLSTGEIDRVLAVFNRMVERGIEPVFSTNAILIKAGVKADLKTLGARGSEERGAVLSRAEEILEQVLERTDAQEIAGRGPLKGIGRQSIRDAYPGAYFEFLIFVYGQQKAFDKVQALYDRYLQSTEARPRGGRAPIPPAKLLSALMVTAYRRGDADEVARCWQLAVEQAAKQARRWTSADPARRNWVLPASRFLLNIPLSYYLKSLAQQERVEEMRTTVQQMQDDGYALDKKNWNLYIQLLAQHGRAVEAFELCEAKLMKGWKGWNYQRQRMGLSKTRNRPSNVKDLRPNYHTLVYLARAAVDMRRAAAARDVDVHVHGPEGAEKRPSPWDRVSASCPQAMEAVQNMPNEEDDVQVSILR
ncbi:MAG: hypothetical protein M1838_002464 [Thelocarpon superellum]|nr:MAG: hypothetical protein M1838_002464 [Thelocarpon superellum]